jgi:5-deoxy-glucuronate isomerase
MSKEDIDLNHPRNWKYSSSDEQGFQEIITPENSSCRQSRIFRLNLEEGMDHELLYEDIELSIAIIKGSISIECNGAKYELGRLDSIYLPAKEKLKITAEEDACLYIGGGPYEGIGEFFVREFDSDRPIGNIHQVHGEPPYERDVHIALDENIPASRIISGFTFGEKGKWTSWPPHQHSEDLEEVYCYFDIPEPKYALHLSSRKPGEVEAVHTVSSGDFVAIPEGYHPSVGIPGARSCYFWVMVAHSQESRRYDLAIDDPNFSD